MNDPLVVPENEYGHVRVFAVDADARVTPEAIGGLLGADLDAEKVEVVEPAALDGMGLTRYLVEGYGIPEDSLRDKRAALNAHDGAVVLVPSSAFRGRGAVLEPGEGLRLLGLFSEEPDRAHDMTQPHRETQVEARASTADAALNQPSRRGSSMIVLGALVVAAIILIALIL